MSIERGDILIMTQHGIRHVVEATSGLHDGIVQIKNQDTFSPCPVQDLSEPCVLVDPSGKGIETGGHIFADSDGKTTEDRASARLFKNSDEAIRFRKDYAGLAYFVPKQLKDCVG